MKVCNNRGYSQRNVIHVGCDTSLRRPISKSKLGLDCRTVATVVKHRQYLVHPDGCKEFHQRQACEIDRPPRLHYHSRATVDIGLFVW